MKTSLVSLLFDLSVSLPFVAPSLISFPLSLMLFCHTRGQIQSFISRMKWGVEKKMFCKASIKSRSGAHAQFEIQAGAPLLILVSRQADD